MVCKKKTKDYAGGPPGKNRSSQTNDAVNDFLSPLRKKKIIFFLFFKRF